MIIYEMKTSATSNMSLSFIRQWDTKSQEVQRSENVKKESSVIINWQGGICIYK